MRFLKGGDSTNNAMLFYLIASIKYRRERKNNSIAVFLDWATVIYIKVRDSYLKDIKLISKVIGIYSDPEKVQT